MCVEGRGGGDVWGGEQFTGSGGQTPLLVEVVGDKVSSLDELCLQVLCHTLDLLQQLLYIPSQQWQEVAGDHAYTVNMYTVFLLGK